MIRIVNKQKINFYTYLELFQQFLYLFLDFQFPIFLGTINSTIGPFQENLITSQFLEYYFIKL